MRSCRRTNRIEIILRQEEIIELEQARIEQLEARVAELEALIERPTVPPQDHTKYSAPPSKSRKPDRAGRRRRPAPAARLLVILHRDIEGLKRVQAPSGLWRQVLHRPELWEETSCTGMFAFGTARACNRGWVSRDDLAVAENAVEALRTRVAWHGSVVGTCVGTGIGRDLRYYLDRPRPVNDAHGPGPVMLAGAEVLAARR